MLQSVRRDALALIGQARAAKPAHWVDIQAFLSAFPISEPAGCNLLQLAEALPRTVDDRNQVALLADKLAAVTSAEHAHAAHASRPWFDAGTRAALRMATGVLPSAEQAASGHVQIGVAASVVRPVARSAIAWVGKQFVFSEAVDQALAIARHARAERGASLRYSYDMLGEGARSWADADRNLERYAQALDAIARCARADAGMANDGMSIKISAIHPRYELAHYPRERARLLERLAPLFEAAAAADINLTIDAEESTRLPMHLDLFAALARLPGLRAWGGLGLVVQAYQLRATAAVDAVLAIAAERRAAGGAPVAVRLVKGAYWDAEIKRAQELGLAGYPVFTEKGSTDRSYLGCAAQLLSASAAVFAQFATHNAVTIAAVMALARQRGVRSDRFELQRLHGMGEAIHAAAAVLWPAAVGTAAPACRVYAPVGDQTQLLAYLIRRMLENGASTSFVRRLADPGVSAEAIVVDELAAFADPPAGPYRIARPPQLYGAARRNAAGLDPADPAVLARLAQRVAEPLQSAGDAAARPVAGRAEPGWAAIRSPADRERVIAALAQADTTAVDAALARATTAFAHWQAEPVDARAARLERWADALESDMDALLALCVQEAGKTIVDAIADVREAVDFCRYYAVQARRLMGEPLLLQGPTGEHNELWLAGRGVFACISPWNFPVAIFVGQVAAALATGNTVVAKPAEQTPLAALRAVRLAHDAGIPKEVLQLLPGPGESVGAALVADKRIAGVVFTGSNATAKSIQRTLCDAHAAILPLVAETGGQNAMIVDSTALPEQVVDAVMQSAFRSAGQRCSALRVLAVQHEVADALIEMVLGAMQTLVIGDPTDPATDVGPVIDEEAAGRLTAHVEAMRARGHRVWQLPLPEGCARGSFVAPAVIEISHPSELDAEHFGPILHLMRFRIDALDALVGAINELGFGLTLGVHTRIAARAEHIRRHARVGNVYVNRNMIGAVVGVQPFGGEGLSGTGPKAGGPHYLLRFVAERTLTIDTAAAGGNLALLAM